MSDAALAWPLGWPRAEQRQRSQFKTTFSQARIGLLRELQLLGATGVIISTNLPMRRDGMPYANTREPDDPGVAIYFTLNGEERCIPCDKWDRVRDNLHAVELTIAALRGLERWGAKAMVDAAFRGFAALPPGGTSHDPWWVVLDLARDATRAEIEAAYRRLAKRYHPDRGGSVDLFHALQTAYQQAREQVTT